MRARLGRVLPALGVAAAVIVAVLSNVLAARHYRRWDWTSSGLYSISRVTEQTLRGLTKPVSIYVLMSRDDTMTLTLRHLLEVYRGIHPQLRVEFIDPDRSPAELLAVQKAHGVATAKTEDGRVVTDAQIIVSLGSERRHFITAEDLFEVEAGEEARARPQVEAVLTAAIQMVTRGDAPEVCFTQGHGEIAIDDSGIEGLVAFHSRLEKLNYEVTALPPIRDLEGRDPIGQCALVVVPGPSVPVDPRDVSRLEGYVRGGGNLLLFVGPELGDDGGAIEIGLGPLVALAGLRARGDFVFERQAGRVWPIGQGEAFIAEPQRHPVTSGLADVQGAINVVLTMASSFEPVADATVVPAPLLVTSKEAFGMRDFASWAQSRPEPSPGPGDATGPLGIAYAAELPKRDPKAEHGPRIVVVGTKSAVVGANWTNERLQGTALFVESAISWLASQPVVLDIPAQPARSLAVGLTDELLRGAALKVIGLLPLSMVLLGVGIRLRRRATEKRREPPAAKTRAKTEAKPPPKDARKDAPKERAKRKRARKGRS